MRADLRNIPVMILIWYDGILVWYGILIHFNLFHNKIVCLTSRVCRWLLKPVRTIYGLFAFNAILYTLYISCELQKLELPPKAKQAKQNNMWLLIIFSTVMILPSLPHRCRLFIEMVKLLTICLAYTFTCKYLPQYIVTGIFMLWVWTLACLDKPTTKLVKTGYVNICLTYPNHICSFGFFKNVLHKFSFKKNIMLLYFLNRLRSYCGTIERIQ